MIAQEKMTPFYKEKQMFNDDFFDDDYSDLPLLDDDFDDDYDYDYDDSESYFSGLPEITLDK